MRLQINRKIIFAIFAILSLSLISADIISINSFGDASVGSPSQSIEGFGFGEVIIPVFCGDGICNNGETCSSCAVDCGQCGGGGGSAGSGASTTISGCSLDAECKINQYCFDHKCYNYECLNDSSCNTKKGETCFNHRCVKLFDMEILGFESPVKVGEFFNFTYFVKAIAEIKGDVEIAFWIERDGKSVTSGKDTIYMAGPEEKTKTKELFLPSDTDTGTYEFFIKVTYGTYSASAHRTIEIKVNEGLATIQISESNYILIYILCGVIGLGIIITYIIFYLRIRKFYLMIRKKNRRSN